MSGAEHSPGTSFHATALVYGESGVLIFGPSGSGKSALALALLALAKRSGVFAALVGDDRIYLRPSHGRLIVSGASSIQGLIERRTFGLLTVAPEPTAVVRLLAELSGADRAWPRMPESGFTASLMGIEVSRAALNSSESAADQALAIADCVERMTLSSCAGKRIPLEQCAAVHKNRKVAASPPPDGGQAVD